MGYTPPSECRHTPPGSPMPSQLGGFRRCLRELRSTSPTNLGGQGLYRPIPCRILVCLGEARAPSIPTQWASRSRLPMCLEVTGGAQGPAEAD